MDVDFIVIPQKGGIVNLGNIIDEEARIEKALAGVPSLHIVAPKAYGRKAYLCQVLSKGRVGNGDWSINRGRYIAPLCSSQHLMKGGMFSVFGVAHVITHAKGEEVTIKRFPSGRTETLLKSELLVRLGVKK